MLKNLQGKEMTRVPHKKYFQRILDLLGPNRAEEARAALNEVIDELPPFPGAGTRAFSSSFPGSKLSPWTGV